MQVNPSLRFIVLVHAPTGRGSRDAQIVDHIGIASLKLAKEGLAKQRDKWKILPSIPMMPLAGDMLASNVPTTLSRP